MENEQAPEMPASTAATKAGRNDPCPCGSGKKFKKCCVDKPEFNVAPATAEPSQASVKAAAAPAKGFANTPQHFQAGSANQGSRNTYARRRV
jgi:hypothetical protein